MRNFKTIYTLNKSLFKQLSLNEAKDLTSPDAKDIKRIEDMLKKAPDDMLKLKELAERMVKSIKDADKMLRRYKAAISILGADHPISLVFAKGCTSLNIDINNISGPTDNVTNTTLSVDEPVLDNTSSDDVTTDNSTVTEIDNDKIQLALDKQKSENNFEEFKKDIDSMEDDELLHEMPFEYIKKIQKIKDYFSEKIESINIDTILSNDLKDVLKTKSRYQIMQCDVKSFNLHQGSVILDMQVKFSDKIRVNYGSWKLTESAIVMSNIAYQLFSNSWNVSKGKIFWSDSNYGYYYDRNNITHYTEPYKKAEAFLKLIGSVIEKCMKKHKNILNIVLLYNNTVYNIYKVYNESFLDTDIRYNQDRNKTKVTPINHLRERITNLICDKYNVDEEPSTRWPGFSILSISPGYVRIGCYPYAPIDNRHQYHGNTASFNKYNSITGLTFKDDFNVLYKFFLDTVGINKNYIYALPSRERNRGYIEIGTLQLAEALNRL